jgi:hydroxymethylpyrimidine/phosphomethylpyrimidine kinase
MTGENRDSGQHQVSAGAPRQASADAPRGVPTVLSIAGSDSGGGAGIQADLKAFARCGVHGASAITAITAQNTLAVSAIHAVPPEIILAQVRAVVADIGVDAVKVGMLGTVAGTLAVAHALDELPAGTPVVVDPVMVAESGARLLEPAAERALIEEILPRATVLTPNLPEARVLAGRPVGCSGENANPEPVAEGAQRRSESSAGRSASEMTLAQENAEAEQLIRAVAALGPRNVVLTGGHRGEAVDLFLDGAGDRSVVRIAGERHPDGAAHGSGCTHSSVLAAQLALGRPPLQAARIARALTGEAVARGLRDVGAGAGPVDVIDLARMRAG